MPDIKEKLVELMFQTNHVCDVYSAADHLIANGVTIQPQEHIREATKMVGWISVEERLPKPGQLALVYCRSQMYKQHITVSTYTGDYSYRRRCCWSRRVNNVTHWMPLPEPPKGE